MRRTLRTTALAGVLGIIGLAGVGATQARAHDGFGYPGGSGGYPGGVPYGPGFPGGFGAFPGGSYGGGYHQYYGNGGHDLQPHWHRSTTPFGTFSWFGNGPHDLQPHEHVRSPYGGYRGYSANPFGGVTESFYPSTPYTFMPW